RLQAIGALPNDLTHTPREYVRVLSGTQTAENTKSFRTLANAIERCWYACMPATPEDFSICLKSLEALGCKRD
ncbi:MAG: DUF4129 domain-containing protein, partial [Acidobacteriaceae bacterium]|nr:DUF4129 domain-containing protein [Acidobacteriaceae bacterium]